MRTHIIPYSIKKFLKKNKEVVEVPVVVGSCVVLAGGTLDRRALWLSEPSDLGPLSCCAHDFMFMAGPSLTCPAVCPAS